MKIKMVVIDLELSRSQRHVVAGAIGLGVLVSSLAVAFADVEKTWKDGDVLTAADLNASFAKLDERLSLVEQTPEPQIPVVTEWTAYTPDLWVANTNVNSHATRVGYWRQVGDSIEVRIHATFAGDPPADSDRYEWSLPVGVVPDTNKFPPGGWVGGGRFDSIASGNSMVAVQVGAPAYSRLTVIPQGGGFLTPDSVQGGTQLAIGATVPVADQ